MIYAEALVIAAMLSWLAQISAPLRNWTGLTLAVLALFLVGFCAARAIGVDGDSPLYSLIFETCHLRDSVDGDICQIEPGFYAMAAVARILGGMGWIQLLMATAALLPKLLVWQRFRCLAVAVPMYFALWYPLHEMTQIRAAVATGLALIGCQARAESGRWQPALPWFVGAVLFHSSALAVLPTLWIFERRPGLVLRSAVVFGIGIALWFSGPVLNSLLASTLSNSRHASYLEEEVSQELTGAGFLYQILFYLLARVLVVWFGPFEERDSRMVLMGIALLEMSLVAFLVFSSIPAFQLRFTQLLFSLGLIGVALPLSRTGWPVLAWLLGVIVALPFFFYNFEKGVILGPYQTAF